MKLDSDRVNKIYNHDYLYFIMSDDSNINQYSNLQNSNNFLVVVCIIFVLLFNTQVLSLFTKNGIKWS